MPARLRDPIFIFDSGEDFLPVAVESVEAVPATMIGLDGRGGGEVSLASLPPQGGRMNFPPDPERYEPEMRGDEAVRGIGVCMLLPALGQHVLLRRLQHGKPADFLEVPGESTGSANDARKCLACHLSSCRRFGQRSHRLPRENQSHQFAEAYASSWATQRRYLSRGVTSKPRCRVSPITLPHGIVEKR